MKPLRSVATAFGLSLALLASACSSNQPVTTGPALEIPPSTLLSEDQLSEDQLSEDLPSEDLPTGNDTTDAEPSESGGGEQIDDVVDVEPTRVDHDDPYCESFLRLDDLGGITPSTPADAEAQLTAMLDEAETLVAVAPLPLVEGAIEMKDFLGFVADRASEENWAIEWFDSLDEEGLATWGVDIEMIDRFLDESGDRCRDAAEENLPTTSEVEPTVDEPTPFCRAFFRLNRLGETLPTTALDAEDMVVTMVVQIEAVIAIAPAELLPSALETQRYLESVAEQAGAQNWDPAWFDAVDKAGFEATGIDLEQVAQFYESGEDRCLIDKFPELE